MTHGINTGGVTRHIRKCSAFTEATLLHPLLLHLSEYGQVHSYEYFGCLCLAHHHFLNTRKQVCIAMSLVTLPFYQYHNFRNIHSNTDIDDIEDVFEVY